MNAINREVQLFKCGLTMASVIAVASAALAKDVYVDDDNYNESYADSAAYIAAGFDGTTEAKAFGTIQAAVDASTTVANDTIIVLPGTYDKGETSMIVAGPTDYGLCRVSVKKSLTIRSRDGSAATHIVGKKVDGAEGLGEGAVRCIANYYAKVHLIGFTLRDGATENTGNDVAKNRGGAAYTLVGDSPIYLVDCVVSNCSGRAGVFRNSMVIRSLVCDNCADGQNPLGMQTVFYNSIITRNRAPGTYGAMVGSGSSSAVNCTIVGNMANYAISSNSSVTRNNVVLLSGSVDGKTVENNVVNSSDGLYQLIAPALGDFRVMAGATAETAGSGDGSDGSDLPFGGVPAAYRNVDFNGNSIPASATIMAGAIQESVAAAGGALQFDGISAASQAAVDGYRSIRAGMYLFPTNYPVQYLVGTRLESGKIYAWDTSNAHGDFHLPDWKTDTLYLMPPPQTGVVMTNTMILAAKEIWLDPVNGSDTEGDGTEGNPYETLQMGVTAGTGNAFVYCKKGTYAKGGVFESGITNRVYLLWRASRYVGVEGADKTFIEGAADTTTVDSQPGCGPAAVRGVYIGGTPITGFEGFTFKNCHTDAKASGVSAASGHQGCVCWSTSDTATFSDCVIDSSCSAAVNAFLGCRLYRCVATNLTYASVPAQNTSLVACLLENCKHATSWQNGHGFHCTLRNSGTLGWNYACIGADSDNIRPASEGVRFAGSIMHNYSSYYPGTTGYIQDNPQFVAASGVGIRRSSPAFTCGERPTAENYGAQYYKYVSTDFYGRPMTFVDGKPVAGADQLGVFKMFATRHFVVEEATHEVSESSDGTVSLPQGQSLQVTMPAGALDVPGGYVLKVVVPAGGLLSVAVNGSVRDFGAGEYDLRLPRTPLETTLAASSVAGTSVLCSLKKGGGMTIVFY